MRHQSLTGGLVTGALLAGCQSAAAPDLRRHQARGGQRQRGQPRRAAGRRCRRQRAAAAGERLARELPKARPALEERFNVSFNNVPAQQFFRSIVAGTRYNMLVHPDVSGSISANLKDVTLPETLDAVREMYGYDYKIDGTRITIRR
jgi:MSHA biogenesis protein MshL